MIDTEGVHNRAEGSLRWWQRSLVRCAVAHIVGNSASELIATFVLAMAFGATATDIAGACFAHSTIAESIKEVAKLAHSKAYQHQQK